MRVRWTEPAARDLTQLCDYIEEHDTSSTARRVAISIYERLSALMEFPEQGRFHNCLWVNGNAGTTVLSY